MQLKLKPCSKCWQLLPLVSFHRDKNSKDGRQARCAECSLKYHKTYYAANAETAKARSKAWYLNNKSTVAERSARWCKENPEKRYAIARKHYDKNIERKAAYRAAYYRKNPLRARLHWAKRRAKMLGQLCDHPNCPEQIRVFYSIRPVGCEVDHVLPIARGGLHCIQNLQFMTRAQNRKKGAS